MFLFGSEILAITSRVIPVGRFKYILLIFRNMFDIIAFKVYELSIVTALESWFHLANLEITLGHLFSFSHTIEKLTIVILIISKSFL